MSPLTDDVHSFASGAKSSAQLPKLYLIPWNIFEDRLANRYDLGAFVKGYGEGNWTSGIEAEDRAFIMDRCSHTIKHLHTVVERLRTGVYTFEDDDAAAVIWGAILIMAVQQHYAGKEPKAP